jgi:hypothetical protein
MSKKNIVLSFLIVLSLALSLGAAELPPHSFKGYGFWQFGQVVKGNNGGTPIERQWVTNALLGLRFETTLNERLNILISPEFRLYFPFPELNNQVTTKRANSVAFINDMNGTIHFGDVNKPVAEWRTGIFTYKYNDDARDFGEYIYRTGTYPPFAITDFDFPKARLCGTSLKVNPFSGLSIDALLTSELLYAPLYDFSLAFFGKYSLMDVVTAGVGIDFARLLPVDEKKTSPDSSVGLNGIDKIMYRKSDGSVGYYSFKATKLMANMSFDLKPFLPFGDIFAKADLKLYGEIGLTGFPIKTVADTLFPYDYYGDISRLMPMMFGFNVPVYSLINKLVNLVSPVNIPLSMPEDVLAIELEYFPSRMPNDYHNAMIGLPNPYLGSADKYYPEMYRDRDWGWAFYTKKVVIPGFSITAQVAYDHLRMSYVDGSTATNECLINKGHWYWVSKVGYSF